MLCLLCVICVVDTLDLQGVSKEPRVHIVRDIERHASSAIVDVHVCSMSMTVVFFFQIWLTWQKRSLRNILMLLVVFCLEQMPSTSVCVCVFADMQMSAKVSYQLMCFVWAWAVGPDVVPSASYFIVWCVCVWSARLYKLQVPSSKLMVLVRLHCIGEIHCKSTKFPFL